MLRVQSVRVKNDYPHLVVMDSLGGYNTGPLKIIREFIRGEWMAREGHRYSARDFSEKGIPSVRPAWLPKQPNGFDCGPYMVTYVEKMFKW